MKRRTLRFVMFGVAILVGIAAGIGYGWAIKPIQVSPAGLPSLRMDYKTDFVLMVAEQYHAKGDLALALAQLTALSDTPPLVLMNEVISNAEAMNYAPGDVQIMWELASAIQTALTDSE